MRELAVRPVDKAPLLDQIEDRLLLPIKQAVDRAAARISVGQRAGLSESLTPAVRTDVGEVKHPTAAGVRPAVGDGAVDQPQQLELWSRRGPGRKARALPSPVQGQLDRELLQRL